MKRFLLLTLCLVIVASVFGIGSRKGFEASIARDMTPCVVLEPQSEMEWVVDQNWDDVEEIPDFWTTIDGDDDGYTWALYTANPHSAPNSAGSYYNADGNDDWLISSAITVEDGYVLDFWYASQDEDWLDAIEVLLSTTGDDPADFTNELLTVAEVPVEWTHASISLDTWVGEDVYIAFHNNSVDEFVLKVDDIRIGTLPPYDVALSGSDALARVDPTDGFAPIVTIVNNGSETVTVDVLCTIKHETENIYEETVTVTDLASGANEELTFPAASSVEGDAAYTVDFSVDLAEDATEENNETGYPMVTWNSQDRKVFVQKFTSVGCGYCPRAAEGIRMLHEELGDEIAIASYHSTTSFGADPFYLEEAVPFATAYGVSGYPSVVTSGFNLISGGYPGPDYGYTQYMDLYDIVSELKTAYSIDLTITSTTALGCNFTTTCEQVAELFDDSAPVLRYAVVRGTVDYTWGSSPELDEIQHAVIDIPGGFDGYEIDESRFIDDNSLSFDVSWDLDDTYLIAFIQDVTGEIYNCAMVPVNVSEVKEDVNRPEEMSIGAYPNPFNSTCAITFNIPEETDHELAIYDINGNVIDVISDGNISAGTYNAVWSANDAPSGVYFYKLTTNNEIASGKVMLLK